MTSTQKKTIVLDPGHGMNEDGRYQRPLMDCTGNEAKVIPNSMYPHQLDGTDGYYREDIGTLKLAKRIQAELECRGHKVFLTRKDKYHSKVYLSSLSNNTWKKTHWKYWKWIRDFTERKNADIFVSIHTNAGGGSGVVGLWADPIKGVELCESIAQEIHSQLGLKIRSIRKKRYLITKNACKGRACLLECLFHDNINEIKLLLTNKGLKKMAKAIADGIEKVADTF